MGRSSTTWAAPERKSGSSANAGSQRAHLSLRFRNTHPQGIAFSSGRSHQRMEDWLGGLDSNQDTQIQSLMSYQLDDLPAGGKKKGHPGMAPQAINLAGRRTFVNREGAQCHSSFGLLIEAKRGQYHRGSTSNVGAACRFFETGLHWKGCERRAQVGCGAVSGCAV